MTTSTPARSGGAASHEQRKVLLMGLPETGKSTFLGALWHVVESKQVPGSLELEELVQEWEYVESLRNRWCSAEAMERTRGVSRQRQQQVVMRLRDPATGAVVSLHVPDHAGEVYEAHWKERQWTREYADFVSGATGVLLFLHARSKHKPEFITDYFATLAGLADLLDDEAEDASDAQGGTDSTPLASQSLEEEYDAAKAAPQVKLVDLLQMHAAHAGLGRPTPVAVVVSAWDVIDGVNRATGGHMTPSAYVRQEAPLLDQYLRANPETYTVRVFGVSAQGGDLEADRERLLAHMKEADRVLVVPEEGQVAPHDITAPLRWLLRGS